MDDTVRLELQEEAIRAWSRELGVEPDLARRRARRRVDMRVREVAFVQCDEMTAAADVLVEACDRSPVAKDAEGKLMGSMAGCRVSWQGRIPA